MKRIGLIIQREYCQFVAKKSFLFTTILLPVLFLALGFVMPILMSQAKSDSVKNVAVVAADSLRRYADALADNGEFHFIRVAEPVDGAAVYEYYLTHRDEQSLYAVVQLPDSVARTAQFTVYSDQSINASLERAVNYMLAEKLKEEKIASYGIEGLDEIMNSCSVDVKSKNVKWDDGGEEKLSSAVAGEVIGFALSFLTYMFVLIYGAMIMNSVIEEKTNRIVEVIVSACKPMELMLGKIIGVALVGFTQIMIWATMLAIGGLVFAGVYAVGSPDVASVATGALTSVADSTSVAAASAALEPTPMTEMQEIAAAILGVDYIMIFSFFIIYFIGGYLLYASLFAAFGSAVDQPSDASQFMMPVTMIMIFSLYAGMFSIENPDGPLAWWCSIIPFTSPIVMMVRLPFDVPLWEMALSVALLYGCALGLVFVAGRIYRTGILMYGKKVGLGDLFKWLKG
ncbi:MAG: ABC transporter permease [Bacteroidaceae bacterium]|nr:ABC transporter permease [Bacteroidaceae bacterium]